MNMATTLIFGRMGPLVAKCLTNTRYIHSSIKSRSRSWDLSRVGASEGGLSRARPSTRLLFCRFNSSNCQTARQKYHLKQVENRTAFSLRQSWLLLVAPGHEISWNIIKYHQIYAKKLQIYFLNISAARVSYAGTDSCRTLGVYASRKA